MKVFDGFRESQEGDVIRKDTYGFMQEVLREPKVITVPMVLAETDLRDMDYAKPVYLKQYSSYFAIVQIQRDSSGVCKVDLVKIP